MKIQEIFNLAVQMGKKADPRSFGDIEKQMNRIRENYEKMSEKEKKYFLKDKLTNPYPDTAIHNMNPDKEVRKVLVGIDVTEGTVISARERSTDLIIGHHPLGIGFALLGDQMSLQLNVYKKYGVPINVIEGLMQKRIEEVNRSLHAINHYIPVDAAKLLGANLINIHTPADNLVYDFLVNEIENKKPEFVEDVLDMLMEIPEFQESTYRGVPPRVFSGNPKNYCGLVVPTEITGGAEGSDRIYPHLINAGVGTVIAMHQSEKCVKESQKSYINVVIASHIASDSLGMNLFLDELEKRGIEILPTSGFIRVSRVKNEKGDIMNSINNK